MSLLNGRAEVWGLAWGYFHTLPRLRQAFGVGPAPVLSNGQLFLHLHNDWLELLLTHGYVGLLLALLFFTLLFWKASHHNRAVTAGFAAAMCGNPVLHFVPTLLILFTVFMETLIAQIHKDRKAGALGKDHSLPRCAAL